MKIHARVGGAIVLSGLPPKADAKVRRAFSFANPEFYRLLAMGKDVYHSGVDDVFSVARDTVDGLVVPRGAPGKVVDALAAGGCEVEWIDERSMGSRIDVPDELKLPTGTPLEPRPFQLAAWRGVRAKRQGLVVVGCGGGKTTIGIGAIAQVKRSAVVLVHTEDLLEQWRDELGTKLGIEAGTLHRGKGRRLDAPVVVAMIQTLARWSGDEIRFVFGNRGMCVMDEAHHAPAEMFMRALDFIPARWRLGLTATPKREDGCGRIVDWCFGDRLIEVPTKKLLAMGFLMRPRLVPIPTAFEFASPTKDKWKRAHEIHAAIERDEQRQHLIASVASAYAQGGEQVLLLANRKQYCRDLSKRIWAFGQKPIVVTSDTRKTSRKRLMAEFRAGQQRFIIATSLANEGLDAPQLSKIIFAWPEKAESGTDQRTGRLMRLYDKEPELIDFIDVRVPELVRRYESRARVYKRLGMSPPTREEIERECHSP